MKLEIEGNFSSRLREQGSASSPPTRWQEAEVGPRFCHPLPNAGRATPPARESLDSLVVNCNNTPIASVLL